VGIVMCAIIDVNVVTEVFGTRPPEAGQKFLEWIENNPNVRLVVGGKLSDELEKVSRFQKWALNAVNSGKIMFIDNNQVDEREEYLLRASACISNDYHIISLAQVSGARLLYSNDKNLQRDFKNRDLINNPQGKESIHYQ